ncbi:MAG: hypothetical protein BYD32DRAFT_426627 [Podila humilis]|nr:MAG: hypothetical protein BYD32DRAFT_426627 [Podila humilis]
MARTWCPSPTENRPRQCGGRSFACLLATECCNMYSSAVGKCVWFNPARSVIVRCVFRLF